MFSVLIPSNVYIECDLSSINCLHHLLHQIYLPRTSFHTYRSSSKSWTAQEKSTSKWSPLLISCLSFLSLVELVIYLNKHKKIFRLNLGILVLNQTPNQELSNSLSSLAATLFQLHVLYILTSAVHLCLQTLCLKVAKRGAWLSLLVQLGHAGVFSLSFESNQVPLKLRICRCGYWGKTGSGIELWPWQ